MAQSTDIPLPEITIEDFRRAWTRFELVATAKKWGEDKQLAIIPTLLRGRLVDYYIDLEEEEKFSVQELGKSLKKRAGLMTDPLAAARKFSIRSQEPQERVSDFATDLKKLFRLAYLEEAKSSSVLLQRFLTGLRPEISRQILLKGRPSSLEKALEVANEVEYVLNFDKLQAGRQDVLAVGTPENRATSGAEAGDDKLRKLEETMCKMVERLEVLESKLQDQRTIAADATRNATPRRSRPRSEYKCFLCGGEGHFKRQCPLNCEEPARTVGGRWPRKQ